MKDEAVLEIKVEDAIQKLADGWVKATREIAQLNATVAQLLAQIKLLTALVDQHQMKLEGRKTGGGFDA
jgi:hypothetical protein